MSRRASFLICTLFILAAGSRAGAGEWVRPTDVDARPLWGHADGIRVGLHPLRGPRGLLRVYTPYLAQGDERVINFIAVEPIVAGQRERGLSELEFSKLDQMAGKRFWSVDDPSNLNPQSDAKVSRGKLIDLNGVETLRIWIAVEKFDNGAHVYLRLDFRADRPHEFSLATFEAVDSKPLDRCIVTATMGNYARLRELHLADGTVARAQQLWPDYKGDGFAPHQKFALSKLQRTADGDVIVSATPDEAKPTEATYAAGTRSHWQYAGRSARQYWRCEKPDPELEAWVNGRFVYWASQSPIPGGIAFENFELVAPFRQGREFFFGVEPIATQDQEEK